MNVAKTTTAPFFFLTIKTYVSEITLPASKKLKWRLCDWTYYLNSVCHPTQVFTVYLCFLRWFIWILGVNQLVLLISSSHCELTISFVRQRSKHAHHIHSSLYFVHSLFSCDLILFEQPEHQDTSPCRPVNCISSVTSHQSHGCNSDFTQ